MNGLALSLRCTFPGSPGGVSGVNECNIKYSSYSQYPPPHGVVCLTTETLLLLKTQETWPRRACKVR